jgi:hypothetical protein
MTAPPKDSPTTLVDGWKDRVLIDEEAANLARRFPDVAVWFGAATRRWWALVRSTGRWCLVEAGGPHDLSHLIATAKAVPSLPGNVRPVTVRAVPASPRRPASPESRRRSPGRHARV